MNCQVKIGLLPLYLKLYDERLPHLRRELEAFMSRISSMLEAEGANVDAAPICRVANEFGQAVQQFEQAGVDCIVTLHLAYSPSLEAIPPLVSTALPIILCDTTVDASFDTSVNPGRLLYNHGIHGVQDLASMLRRHKCPYQIVAGHPDCSDVIARTVGAAKAAQASRRFCRARVLRLGPVFEGMGDFVVPDEQMQTHLGIHTHNAEIEALAQHVSKITEDEVAEEMARDGEVYTVEADEWAHRRTTRVGLGLRRLLEDGNYDAFSMHFGSFDAGNPDADAIPFIEASKAMSRNIGYAGEGDVLTAALVGALSCSFGNTTFTEMFCPDWVGGSIFLSHMGEINPAVAADKPVLCDKPMPFCDSTDTAILALCPRTEPGCLVNVAPQTDGRFALIIAPVESVSDKNEPNMRTQVRGWVKPPIPLPEFLEKYSDVGGTHHLALTLDVAPQTLATMGRFLGMDVYTIK